MSLNASLILRNEKYGKNHDRKPGNRQEVKCDTPLLQAPADQGHK